MDRKYQKNAGCSFLLSTLDTLDKPQCKKQRGQRAGEENLLFLNSFSLWSSCSLEWILSYSVLPCPGNVAESKEVIRNQERLLDGNFFQNFMFSSSNFLSERKDPKAVGFPENPLYSCLFVGYFFVTFCCQQLAWRSRKRNALMMFISSKLSS